MIDTKTTDDIKRFNKYINLIYKANKVRNSQDYLEKWWPEISQAIEDGYSFLAIHSALMKSDETFTMSFTTFLTALKRKKKFA